MQPSVDTTLNLIRRRDRAGDPLDYRRVRRALQERTVVRVAPGSFADPTQWNGLSAIEQHCTRMQEAADRMRAPAVFSHRAAAALWGMDILGAWPHCVDVRVSQGRGGRSTGLIRRHTLGLTGIDLVSWREHWVTSPAQTAIDLAATSDLLHGVVILDQSLWARRPGGPLATIDELHSIAERWPSPKGASRMRRALELATGLSDSVRESQSRVLLGRLGFPEPVLQHPIPLAGGRIALLDFYFPDHDHGGECDGAGKYVDPALLAGRRPEQALMAEKDRGDAVRRRVSRLSRWRTPDLRRPRQLYDILTADGLPSALPAPPAGLVVPD